MNETTAKKTIERIKNVLDYKLKDSEKCVLIRNHINSWWHRNDNR